MSALKAFLIIMRNAFLMAWEYLVAIMAVFFVTFVIFPGVITDTNIEFLAGIEDSNQRIAWTMLIFIFTFNLADTVGRWLGG
jgi:hypothetical protein